MQSAPGHASGGDGRPFCDDRRWSPCGLPPWPGHIIVYATPAFLAACGSTCLGLPAREALPDLPAGAFALLDRVLREGHPLACRIETPHGQRRLVVVPRRDPDGETYGVTTHLVALAASVGE